MKKCKTCKKEKDLTEYHIHNMSKDGLRYSCKSCRSAYNIKHRDVKRDQDLKRKYDISLDVYEEMNKAQDNKCYICKEKQDINNEKYHKRLVVDHCHTTGKVRKLLCNRCNRTLGMLKEDEEILTNMIEYIKTECTK